MNKKVSTQTAAIIISGAAIIGLVGGIAIGLKEFHPLLLVTGVGTLVSLPALLIAVKDSETKHEQREK